MLPVTTAFTSAEEFEAEAFTSNLAKWNNTGVIGYVVLGQFLGDPKRGQYNRAAIQLRPRN